MVMNDVLQMGIVGRILLVLISVSIISCGTLLYEEAEEIEDKNEEILMEKNAKISLSINESSFEKMKDNMYEISSVWSKDMANIDTNNFILSIYSQYGTKIYDGKYGLRPTDIVVVPGAYDVKIYSTKLKAPAFDTPVYGDEQTVVVKANSSVSVVLQCRQVNSAVRISFTDQFKKQYPGNGVLLKDENGEIEYQYSDYRFCYLTPGKFELFYKNSTEDTLLFTREIPASQMLSLNLSYAPHNKSAALNISLDTSRLWKVENFNAGLKIPTGAVTIDQAKQMIGEKNVMVFGFILGGDVTENTIRVKPPFSSRTNLIIATSMKERNRYNMFAVELPSGEVRDGLNLVSNRELLGSAVVIIGNIVESYYGYPGIKSTKSYAVLY